MLPESRDYPLSEQVVHWIRWARRHKGMTLRDLAERVEDVTIGTLSNIELGRHVPRHELAERRLGSGAPPVAVARSSLRRKIEHGDHAEARPGRI